MLKYIEMIDCRYIMQIECGQVIKLKINNGVGRVLILVYLSINF